MKKYDVDYFTYKNLKYWIEEKKQLIDKINDFWEKIFLTLFTLNWYWEKISNKLMDLITKEKNS